MAGNILWKWQLGQEGNSHAQYPIERGSMRDWLTHALKPMKFATEADHESDCSERVR